MDMSKWSCKARTCLVQVWRYLAKTYLMHTWRYEYSLALIAYIMMHKYSYLIWCQNSLKNSKMMPFSLGEAPPFILDRAFDSLKSNNTVAKPLFIALDNLYEV